VGHGAGDNPQAIIEYSLVVHRHEFYFALLLPVNETLLLNIIRAKPSLNYRASFTYGVLVDYAFRKKWIKLEFVSNLPLMLWLAYFFL
jgi:hypothetical protein